MATVITYERILEIGDSQGVSPLRLISCSFTIASGIGSLRCVGNAHLKAGRSDVVDDKTRLKPYDRICLLMNIIVEVEL